MKQYNQEYINQYIVIIMAINDLETLKIDKQSYEVAQVFSELLLPLLESCKNRYEDNKKVNGEAILTKESLDHYATKQLLECNNFMQVYLNVIENDINLAKEGHALHNHFLNTIPNEKLQEVLPKDLYEDLLLIKEKQQDKTSEIMSKIKSNEKITQEELNYICDCFAFNRDKDDKNHEILIDYIFNNLTQKDCTLTSSTFVVDAIISYVPKFFKTKENNDFSNTRIVNHCEKPGFLGRSMLQNVYVGRDFYKDIDFKYTGDAHSICDNNSKGYISFLQTVFHELVHVDQNKNKKKNTFNENGFMAIAEEILRINLNDYELNHDAYETEINADQKGWLHVREFISTFIKDNELKKTLLPQFLENSVANHYRRATSLKMRKYKPTKYDTDFFDIDSLNEIIEKAPDFFTKEYPMLKTFYDETTGHIKLDFLKDPNMRKSVIGKNYTKYVILNRSEEVKEILKKTDSEESLSNMISNIYAATMDEEHKKVEPDFIKQREIKNGRNELATPYELFRRSIRSHVILSNAIKILNNPYTINRKTVFFSPIVYINRLSEKINNQNQEQVPAFAR